MVVIRDNWPILAKIRYILLMCRIQKWTKLFIISNADKKKVKNKVMSSFSQIPRLGNFKVTDAFFKFI